MKITLEVKVHDRDCGLLIVHGVIMTNEGQAMVGEDTRGNAVMLIMGSHQHSKLAETSSGGKSAEQRSTGRIVLHCRRGDYNCFVSMLAKSLGHN